MPTDPRFSPMPATETAESAHDPEAIEAEISDLEDRRARLEDKREAVEADLEDARRELQEAEDEEAQDEALDRAERLQLQSDTLQEAITDVETDLEVLRNRLSDARAARREEEKLEALAEKGREAIEARREYESVRDEILELLREKAPELAERFQAWADATDHFRDALQREERGVYVKPSTTDADEARAEELISELKGRGVEPFKTALAPHRTSMPERFKGWSYEEGYSTPEGRLGDAVEAVRKFGNQSAQSSE